eukprot:CAMPEP_0181476968 /NCGR_PEP_ID=MMETSP1110-20121109/41977_1 /TAXON_ID=174948 /ORGANISM="Symbiodinium sp., Strain CCMP421" /LENGTH=203 /DNA_ID=CAMNT_0023602261 /DNA_START=61 /DNA_END=672 /DNA_ORIENTATION=+
MQRSSRALLLLGACGALCWQAAFLAPSESGASRRAVLTAASMGLLGTMGAETASAADFFGLPHIPGPFEMDPKEAVVIGDAADPQVKDAKAKVLELQTQAEQALDMIQKDPQADLSFMVKEFGIGDLRDATNVINDIMDDKTAAATQRWQRLMIQAKYQWEDDIPFPVTKRGVQKPRGDKRNERIISSLKNYISGSKELLQFF